MKTTPFAMKKSLAIFGFALFSSSVSVAPGFAQNKASGTPYCFVATDTLSVFSRPDPGAATADRFNAKDIVYATANPPTTVFAGGRAFVEVAIYGGNRGWLPRASTIDGVPLIVDLTSEQCTNPPPGAVGYTGGSGSGSSGWNNTTPYCFAVRTPLNVYSRPVPGAITGDRYAIGDIAYATANPPRTVISGGIPFVEVAIYGKNIAWAPRYVNYADVPALVDLTTDQCTNPPPRAAGG